MKPTIQKPRLTYKQFWRLKGMLLIFLFSIASAYAQNNDQLQLKGKVIKNFQDFHQNNLTIKHLQENKTLQPETVPANVMQILPNQTYVVREKITNIKAVNASVYKSLDKDLKKQYNSSDIKMLPETFIQTGSSANDQLVYRIGFESKLPLEYLFNTGEFEGTVKFFLFPESRSMNDNLKIPVLIQIVSNDIRTIDPVSKEIDHLSIPLTEIRFQGSHLSDSAQVKIITKSNPEGYETYLKVRPAVELDSKRSILQGLGVQSIPVSLKILGSSMKDSVKVSFTVGKGTIEPNPVFVYYDRPSVVNLRSEGLGSTVLTTSSVFNSNELNFTYTFPWVFILMAVIGGIIGALAKYFSRQEKLSLRDSVLKGILLGFLGSVVYYVLGINLIEFNTSDVFNEFAVLGFSALVAFFGIRTKEKPVDA